MIENPLDGPTIREAKKLLAMRPQPQDIVKQLDALKERTPEAEKFKFTWLYESINLDELLKTPA